MNSNYPYGAENDPRAPWNDNSQEEMEKQYDDNIDAIRGDLAEALSSEAWEVITNYVQGDIALVIYEEITDQLKYIWER